jgi:hypothetical protein
MVGFFLKTLPYRKDGMAARIILFGIIYYLRGENATSRNSHSKTDCKQNLACSTLENDFKVLSQLVSVNYPD